MAKTNNAPNDKKSLKKEISYQLDQSLGKLKDFLGEKEYNSRIKKAVKILTSGIDKHKKAEKKKPEAPAAKPAKKAAIKTTPVKAAPAETVSAEAVPVKVAPVKKQGGAPVKKAAKPKPQPADKTKA